MKQTIIRPYLFRKGYKVCRVHAALPASPLQTLRHLRKRGLATYIFYVLVAFTVYCLVTLVVCTPLTSYNPINPPVTVALLPVPGDSYQDEDRRHFWIEELGGDGPVVIAYRRVSSSRQVKKKVSLDAQEEELRKFIELVRPSKIFWVTDPGITGTDFTKRQINKMRWLHETEKVVEIWTCCLDRLGRECVKLLIFLLEFCDEGGIIRSPKQVYDPQKDRSSLSKMVDDAIAADQANRDRIEHTKRALCYKFKTLREWKWPISFGYKKKDKWLEKDILYEPFIRKINSLFLDGWTVKEIKALANKEFADLPGMPLSECKIVRILSDSLYMGRPVRLGETVKDPSLAFIDEESFDKGLMRLEAMNKEKPKMPDELSRLLAMERVDVIELWERFPRMCPYCGGRVIRNGPIEYDGNPQEIIKCTACKAQWRFDLNPRRIKGHSNMNLGSLQSHDNNKADNNRAKPNTKNSKKVNEIGQKPLSDFHVAQGS